MGVAGAPMCPQIWSRIEQGAVTDASLCRSLPLLAEPEL